ncbi:Dynein light chain Tctex-type 1 [Plasmodiophora brassicae]|uniref:Dynein light chain Tctex-type 1 n=1 Tax=Plasmodiophora brassicae TaxID=37360 RepID=A0A0G4J486_PLABS|nr:hypothetical protein PBRA_002409 [Plasmodiophora brassicae]SPQ93665.1 unnamed protein product [Plasmodiophora brassicae]
MSDFGDDDTGGFDHDEVKACIEQSVEPVLGQSVYHAKRVHDWTAAIIESVLKNLRQLDKNFKYIVTSTIMQRNGAGMHTSSACFWDLNTDGSCSVKWENQTMHCVVTVFAVHV